MKLKLPSEALQRATVTERLPYFNAEGAHLYEGVGSLWFDKAASIGLFRAHERAHMRINAQSDRAFYLPEDSFFICAHEVDVL